MGEWPGVIPGRGGGGASDYAGGEADGIPVFRNSSKERGEFFLQPLGRNVPIFVANEAFGWPSCWAESALVMAENAVTRMQNLSRPAWLPDKIYQHILYQTDDHRDHNNAGSSPSSSSDLSSSKA